MDAVPPADPAADPGPPADVPAGGGPAGGGPAAPPPARRPERSPRDMLMSILVILLPILLFLGFYQIVLDGDEPIAIDTAPAIAAARTANAFPVSEPTGLAEGWRPTAASFRQVEGGQTLRIGYVTPSGASALMVQSSVPAETLLPAELTKDARPRDLVHIGARSWQGYQARPGEQALVLLEPARTLLIVGSAAEKELGVLAGSLS